MNRFKKVAIYDIPRFIKVADILNVCGKDMAAKYDLHHWDNSYLKSLFIVCLCALKNQIYLLYSNGKPVATFQVKAKKDILHFEKLGTLPTEEGKGIGTLCMKKIEDIASECGCHKVVMEVYEPSRNAVCFYEHRGYQSVGTVNTLKYKEIRMEKEINKKERVYLE